MNFTYLLYLFTDDTTVLHVCVLHDTGHPSVGSEMYLFYNYLFPQSYQYGTLGYKG